MSAIYSKENILELELNEGVGKMSTENWPHLRNSERYGLD